MSRDKFGGADSILEAIPSLSQELLESASCRASQAECGCLLSQDSKPVLQITKVPNKDHAAYD
jgi:hypothetical protein